MTEYTIYFATVCGLLKVRFGSRSRQLDLSDDSYRTHVLNPLAFCGLSAFITLQNAMYHWLTALVICCFLASGTAMYKSLWWQQLLMNGRANG